MSKSWSEMFGQDVPGLLCRDNWERFKAEAIQNGHSDVVEYWMGHECGDCDKCDGDWCKLSDLPCSFNPVLTPKTGMIGMACMGMYQPADGGFQ